MAEPPSGGPSAGADDLARAILEKCGGEVRLALPLGLGKPVRLVNALTRLVADTPDAQLSILTALTLERPAMAKGMAHRLLAPAADRLFGASPGLEYARMRRDGGLPDNIEVSEFFMQAGRWLNQPEAQQAYIAANYTHALDVLCDWKPNLLMQLLAREGDRLSLSSNTDITVDMLRLRAEGAQDFAVAGEVSDHLPFFGAAAEIGRDDVEWLLDDGAGPDLFSVVKRPVGAVEHAIGLHVARTVPDGGTLQIGIGAIGDAVAHALLLRDRDRAQRIWRAQPFARDRFAEVGRFRQGLYGVTEMLVDGLLHLFEEGVIRRRVDGCAIHAGFFVDCRDFYRRLREMPADRRARIAMMPVSFTNALYGDEEAKRAARTGARFVNAAMKATLLGGVVSDATASGQVVSGVGGQANFVEQAFALDGAHSVITLPATRRSRGRLRSNIVWDHPHETVTRPFRDLVVTEYGIADLRGSTDAETVAEMLKIADSRFQPSLLRQAKKAGKIAADYTIPPEQRRNLPETLSVWLRPHDLPEYPFGTDFTPEEQRLLPALEHLKRAEGAWPRLAAMVAEGLVTRPDEEERACLERMGLAAPRSPRERAEAAALLAALARGREDD